MRILSFTLVLCLASSSFAAQIVAMDVVGVAPMFPNGDQTAGRKLG
ncbi:MAG: hypothetical protein OSB21_14870 [Myxococcota bacterium]|nr:hypothetical protein [Myxococcota bacterium]